MKGQVSAMLRRWSTGIGLVFLIGCASSKTIIGPDGTENQLISCSAIEDCYSEAHRVCRGPYKIVHTSSETSGMNGVTGTDLKLLVKCGP